MPGPSIARGMLILVICLPAALAVGSGSASDPVGDQTLEASATCIARCLRGEEPPCEDPTTDLTGLAISVTSTTVVVTSSVVDVDGVVACEGVPLDVLASADQHATEWFANEYVVPHTGDWYLFTERDDAFHCGHLWLTGVGASGCIGTIATSGDSTSWTVARTGTVTVEGTPTSYALNGVVNVIAETTARVDPIAGGDVAALWFADRVAFSTTV